MMTRGCLLPEIGEEEDPAGAFGLPVDFPASPVEEGPSLIALFTRRSTSSSVSSSLAVA